MTPVTNNTIMILAERVEAAEGPSRHLDNSIQLAINNGCAFSDDPPYTASIDAAMTLYVRVPERISNNPRLVAAEALRQRAEHA